MGHPGINVHDASDAAELASTVDRTSAMTPGIAALQRRHGAMGADDSFWVPPVIRLSATANQGVAELAQGIDSFVEWTERSGRRQAQTRERAYAQLLRGLSSLLLAPYLRQAGSHEFPANVASWIGRIADGQSSPLEAAHALVTSQELQTTGSDT
jgi:LAO/AO transport system kinase